MEFLPDGCRVAHGDGGLDHQNGIGIALDGQADHRFHGRGVEEILLAVVVRGRGHHHEVSVLVGRCAVQRGHQIQFLFREILLDVLVLNGADPMVDLVDLLRDDVHSGHVVVLGQQHRNGQAYISGTGNCDIHLHCSF